jgi:enamine deaminase RidA (YjgF/YER057c/UK114 family)
MMHATGEERDMAHQRLRTLNARELHPGSQLDVDMARVVRAGKHVFLSGISALTLDGRMVGVGDPAAQAEQAMATAKQLLEEAGSSLDHVCKVTTYITDRGFRVPIYNVVGRWLKGVFPCGTGIIVNGLPLPEMLVQLDLAAVIPD